MTKRDPKNHGEAQVQAWAGGKLRIVTGERVLVEEDGAKRLEFEPKELGMQECSPFGDGFALVKPTSVSVTDQEHVFLDIEVRDGRPQCVGIRSEEGGPEITTSLLREIRMKQEIRYIVSLLAVRLLWDEEREEVVGEHVLSPRSMDDRRPWGEMTEGVVAAIPKRRGRPRLSDEFLSEVAEIYRVAETTRQKTTFAIMNRWEDTAPATARGWIAKARERGFLEPPTRS